MVVQFINAASKLAGGKVFLLPLAAISIVTFGSVSLVYKYSRDTTAKLVGCNEHYDDTSLMCQTTCTAVSSLPTLYYIYYRYKHYTAPNTEQIIKQIELYERNNNPLNDKILHVDDKQALYNKITQQRRLLYHQMKAPVKFYSITLLASAIIVGISTSIAQRMICENASKIKQKIEEKKTK